MEFGKVKNIPQDSVEEGNLTFAQLCRLYEQYGFVIEFADEGRRAIATFPGSPIKRVFAHPKDDVMKPDYVRKAWQAIQEALETTEWG